MVVYFLPAVSSTLRRSFTWSGVLRPISGTEYDRMGEMKERVWIAWL